MVDTQKGEEKQKNPRVEKRSCGIEYLRAQLCERLFTWKLHGNPKGLQEISLGKGFCLFLLTSDGLMILRIKKSWWWFFNLLLSVLCYNVIPLEFGLCN